MSWGHPLGKVTWPLTFIKVIEVMFKMCKISLYSKLSISVKLLARFTSNGKAYIANKTCLSYCQCHTFILSVSFFPSAEERRNIMSKMSFKLTTHPGPKALVWIAIWFDAAFWKANNFTSVQMHEYAGFSTLLHLKIKWFYFQISCTFI